MFCGNCGNELRPDTKFCPKCGGKVLPIQEQPAQVKASEDTVAVSSPVPEKPEKNESQSKAAPIQQEVPPSSGLVADITDSIREALRGESYYCGKCGTKLKPGAKFCPECGAFTGMLSKDASGETKVSGGVGDLFASKTGQRKEQSSQQAGVDPIQESYETFGGGTGTVVQAKKKFRPTWKFWCVWFVAVVLFAIMIDVLDGSGSNEDYITCAKQLIAEQLKSPSSAIYLDGAVEEIDKYGRILVFVDFESQNSFGGMVRKYAIVVLQEYNNGKFSYNPYYAVQFYSNSYEKETAISLAKRLNSWDEPRSGN